MDYINELLLQKRYDEVFSRIYSLVEEKEATKELYPILFKLAKLGYHFQVYDILTNLSIPGKMEKRIIENEIKSEQKYMLLNDYQKEIYNDAIWRISEEIKNKEYISAYMYASYAYSITGMPEMLYYKGKALFKMKDNFNARNVFLEYIKVGSERVNKAYIFLHSISIKVHSKTMANYYKKEMDKLEYLYQSNFDYKDIEYHLRFYKKEY